MSVTTVQNGNATDAATWGGALPTALDDVVIAHVVTIQDGDALEYVSVTFDAAGAAANIIASGTCSLTSGAITLTNPGNPNGVFILRHATVFTLAATSISGDLASANALFFNHELAAGTVRGAITCPSVSVTRSTEGLSRLLYFDAQDPANSLGTYLELTGNVSCGARVILASAVDPRYTSDIVINGDVTLDDGGGTATGGIEAGQTQSPIGDNRANGYSSVTVNGSLTIIATDYLASMATKAKVRIVGAIYGVPLIGEVELENGDNEPAVLTTIVEGGATTYLTWNLPARRARLRHYGLLRGAA